MVEKWTLPRRVNASPTSSTSRITPNRKSTNAATATFSRTSGLGKKREPPSMRALPESSRNVVAVTARLRRRTAKAPSSPPSTEAFDDSAEIAVERVQSQQRLQRCHHRSDPRSNGDFVEQFDRVEILDGYFARRLRMARIAGVDLAERVDR